MSSDRVQPFPPPTGDGLRREVETKSAALCAVAAAAALRSEPALRQALEEALDAGAGWEELERAVATAGRAAETAVLKDGLRTLRDVRARQGAKERWNIAEKG